MAVTGLLSCSDTSCRDALQRAEALMESDPQSARAVLDSLNLQSSIFNFQSKRDAALYALLRTQADYKCRVRLTSDSLPLIATNYYGTKRKTQRAALAQYYLGCTYSDMHRDLDAIDAFLRATTLFPDTTNKYFANCLFELGLLYSNHHMQDNAWTTFCRYRGTEVCNSDSMNICYADYYLGSVALYHEDIELTDSLFRCVERNTSASDYIRNTAYFQLAKLYYYKKHNIEVATKYLQKIGNYFGKENGAIFILKADILSEQQQPEKAFELYKKAIKNSSDLYIQCSSYEGLAGVSSLIDKKDSTRFFIQQYKSLLDTIITLSQKEKIAEIEDMHIVEIHDQQMKSRNMRLQLAVGIFIIVLLSTFVITLLLIDRKRKNEKLRFEQELNDIKQRQIDQKVDEEGKDGEKNSPTEVNLLSRQFAIQQERVKLYREQFASSRWKKYLSEHRLVIQAKEKVIPTEEMREFNLYLHSLFADIFLDLVNDNAKVSHLALEYIAMKLLGFDTEHIAYCSQSNVHAVHNRRYYLKEKLTPEWYSFVIGELYS